MPIVIGDDFTSEYLKNHFVYRIESAKDSADDYQLISYKNLSLGIVNKKVSIKGRIYSQASSTKTILLEIYNPTIDEGYVYITNNGNVTDTIKFGDKFKFNQRAFKHRNFIFPIAIEPNTEATISIEIEPQLEAMFLPIRLIEEKLFLKKSTKDFLSIGIMLGLYLIYLVFIIGLFIVVKRNLFLFYAIINFFVLMFCAFDTGLGMQFIWGNSPFLQDIVIGVTGFGYVMGMIFFGRAFFSTRIKYPKLDKILMMFIAFAVLSFLAIIILYFILGVPILVPLMLLNVIFILFGITISGLGIVTYLQAGRREGFWFLLLFLVQLIIWLLLLNQRGYLGFLFISPDASIYSFFYLKTATPHYIFINMIAEVLIVSTIIAFRFQNNLEEYNISQKKIEDINEESIKAFIHGQEVERGILAETLEEKLGKDLKSIKREILKSKEVVDDEESVSIALHQLQDVQNDLNRIASDFVINWQAVSLDKIVNRVLDQLQMAQPDLQISHSVSDEAAELNWDDLTKLNIYRMLQEVCNNVIKHSKAAHVNVLVQLLDEFLQIEVKDDGVGFNSNEIALRDGIGLRNIETRVRALKGKLEVLSKVGEGTTTHITIPRKSNINQ
ncbi:MAG: 7TM-DISM domain-containing protein [Chitinophagales bacterium]